MSDSKMKNAKLMCDNELEEYLPYMYDAALRRYYDYSTLGFCGYLKKRICKKKSPNTDPEIKINNDIEIFFFFLEEDSKGAKAIRHYHDYKTLNFYKYITKYILTKNINIDTK